MKDNLPNRDLLSELMQKNQLEMPFADFEETVMTRIRKIGNRKEAIERDRKWSFGFFIIGTSLGFVLNSLLQSAQFPFLPISSEKIVLIFQTVFVLLFLVQFEKNFALIKKWMKRERV